MGRYCQRVTWFSHLRPRWAAAGCGLVVALTGLPAAHALDATRAVKDYPVAEWRAADGLPYPSIGALGQSGDGYLWIATRIGLGRFDGVSFSTFTTKNLPQLADNRIVTLYTDHEGRLWIGTGKGVTWYRNGEWTRPSFGAAVDQGVVAEIFADGDGSMLLTVHHHGRGFGLYRWRAGTCEEITSATGAATPRINKILTTAAGLLFAGQGLFDLEAGKLRELPVVAGPDKPNLLALEIDRAGTYWLGTLNGLLAWDGETLRTLLARDGLPSNFVRSLLIDSDGSLWIGTSNGLARYAHGSFQELHTHGVETLSNVLCLFEDREKNLWVGTDNGLLCVRDAKVASLTARDGLPVNPMLCMLPAKDGTQWIGTIGGGLAHVTADGIHTLRMADGLSEDSVVALAEDASGGLWISYYTRGLSYFKDGAFQHYPLGDLARVRGLGVDRDNRVWAAHSRGVFRFDGTNFEPVLQTGVVDDFRALCLVPNGDVWVTSREAIGRLRDGQWTFFATPEKLRANAFQYLFAGSDGTIWALQDGPMLVRIQNDRRENIPMPAELGPLIYSGFEYQGELWISFRAGVVRIPLAELEAVRAGAKPVPAYTLYNEVHGMRSRAPNNIGSPGSTPMPDGSLWFATSLGMTIIHPDRIRPNRIVPNVVIERIIADRIEYAGPALERIPPGRGELEFRFTALSFTNPSQVRFKYRLQGFDQEWVDAKAERVAHYGGLPPGEYRFEVRACNDDGVWNLTGASVRIVLRPHFYQRWWFFGVVGLVVCSGWVGLFLWRGRRIEHHAQALQRQNEDLERRIAERTAELRVSYEALRSSEYFYHSLVESLPQIIARKDAAGRFTYANAGFSELVGRPLGRIIGHTVDEIYPPERAARIQADDQRVLQLRETMEYEEVVLKPGDRSRYLHVKNVPLFDEHNQPLGVQSLFWDMTLFRETEEKLKSTQRELLEISRLAGIAEMATGILHNLGNALNSVKVAAGVAIETVSRSSVPRMRRLAQMFLEERDRLGEFFATDPRAAKIPEYLDSSVQELEQQRLGAIKELEKVRAGIEHVAQIVAAQQASARVSGIVEDVPPHELIESACRLNEAYLSRQAVTVGREYMPAPPIRVDRQKALQILGNFVRNAIEALAESARPDKRLILGICLADEDRVQLSIRDNGIGIPAEALPRLFEFGYTSKKSGHGFGLHNSALAAKAMGGAIHVYSDGPGKGAQFVLELPIAPATPAAE